MRKLLGAVAVMGAIAGAQHASAAPQILGMVATAEPTRLICENGVCRAEFSTICLQQHRVSPVAGTVYHQAAATRLEMTVTKAGGGEVTVPLGNRARITAHREFTSVMISVPEDLIRSMGGSAARISVPRLASLVPQAAPGDINPLTAHEIAQYTGPLRSAAENFMQADPDLPVAKLLNKVLNAVEFNDTVYMSDGSEIWARVKDDAEAQTAPATRQRVQAVIHECTTDTPNRAVWGTKGCIGLRHGEVLMKTTKDVWKGLGAGS
ncbi:MAG: hypothetical protein OXH94_02485 [Rhodospirillales bacterium]|nr:hypothetical protein [Rhodospirillales bacterium]